MRMNISIYLKKKIHPDNMHEKNWGAKQMLGTAALFMLQFRTWSNEGVLEPRTYVRVMHLKCDVEQWNYTVAHTP